MARINNHLVIMAGGVGSRFWPMSTADKPKQFIDVLGIGKSLLQLTVERFAGIVDAQNVWVVTNKSYAATVAEQLPDMPADHILCEPCRRNTAPCIAYVSWRIKSKDPKANIVVSPSDHVVLNVEEFRRIITSCMKFTSDSDAIVTLGMKPTRPETGYGYIEANLSANSLRNKGIFRVDSFREKPDLKTAQQYIKQNNYYWNAGIFVWNVNTIVNAFRMYQPKLAKIFESMLPVYGTEEEQQVVNEKFPNCENISVDYAIMEKAEEIFVCPADFGWSDIGTWGSLFTHAKKDENGNAKRGKVVSVDNKNTIINIEEGIEAVVEGLEDYLVAFRDHSLLVCKLHDEQQIKVWIEGLK
jgi:mannose-1-phosphate guanylyltransferase